MTSTLKLAVVGVGGIWGAHAKNLSLLGDNQVVAVCDLSEDSRNRWAGSLGARPYADVEEMLSSEGEVDAIISCTPALARRAVVEAASKRKIPTFLEKPPAFTLEDALAINAIARDTQTPVVVGFMYRYFPIVDRMRELLQGRTLNLVQSSFYCPLTTKWAMPAWFTLKHISGGHILDQAIHSMDLVRFFAGDITHVHTLGNNVLRPKTETFTIEDSSASSLRFANGASGSHLHSWTHSEMKVTVSFIGEDYNLTLELDESLKGFVGDEKIDEQLPACPPDASHHFEEMRAFLAAVRSRDFSQMRSPYQDAAKSLATVVAMNQSIESGVVEKVHLDF